MENAILYAGIEELNTIKEYVLELQSYEEKNTELEQEEARLEKVLFEKKKEMAEEIEVTKKKRKKELTMSYESQITKLNAKAKKIKSKKGKEKGQKVAKRVTEATAELREANKGITIDIKALMKKNKVPSICNTTLFYSFFMPKAPFEFLILLFCILFVFFSSEFMISSKSKGRLTPATKYIFGCAKYFINSLFTLPPKISVVIISSSSFFKEEISSFAGVSTSAISSVYAQSV